MPLQADIRLRHREDHKVLSYFLSGGRSEGVCPELQTKLSKAGQHLNMSSRDWDDRKQRLMDGFLPVEEMVKRLNAFDSPNVGEAKKFPIGHGESYSHFTTFPRIRSSHEDSAVISVFLSR